MISVLAQTINLCVSSAVSLLSIAAAVGQVIVGLAAGALSIVYGLCAFMAQVYEENRSFLTEEFPAVVLDTPVVILTHFSEAADVLADLLAHFADSSLHAVGILKSLLLTLGDAVWLLVTFLPLQAPALGVTACKWLLQSILRVPPHTAVGLACAAAGIRIVLQRRTQLAAHGHSAYWWSRRSLALLYHRLYHYLMDDDTHRVASLSRDRALAFHITRGRNMLDVRREDDALCVVCQERLKCVLTMPCRHMCLCAECCIALYNYQRTCPICRTFICHSVDVYI